MFFCFNHLVCRITEYSRVKGAGSPPVGFAVVIPVPVADVTGVPAEIRESSSMIYVKAILPKIIYALSNIFSVFRY